MTIRRAVSAALSSFADSLKEDDPAPSFSWSILIPVGFGATLFLSDAYKRTRAWARANDAVIQRIEERLAGFDRERTANESLARRLALRLSDYAGESGKSEGAEETMTRLLAELGSYRSKVRAA